MVEKKRREYFSQYLQTCDIPVEKRKIEPFTMVIFGGTGDLSMKKLLPALFHLFQAKEFPERFSILGVGGSQLGDDEYRARIKEALMRAADGGSFREDVWGEFQGHLGYFSGNLEKDQAYGELRGRLGATVVPSGAGKKDVVFYLALPPDMVPGVVARLGAAGFADGSLEPKIVVEKPFGRDQRSARELNRTLNSAFEERRIYRIDHYLGKDTVQNIMFLRFSNSIFEHLWNSNYIDNVQITVAEDIGIENRARFYEESGVIRDIVQNHILQVIAMVAMEPPAGFEADSIRDEKTKVFRSLYPIPEEEVDKLTVIGQYGPGKIEGKAVPGYREEAGVAPDSSTPTFFAGVFQIANWRWAGVPFYVRTGKRMARRITQIAIQFQQPPLRLFGRTCDELDPNILFLTIQPEEEISLRIGVKLPNETNQIYPIDLKFNYRETFESLPHPAYERLIMDCLKEDLTLFVRQDQVEAMWAAVDPVIACWESLPHREFPNYAAGTWGPRASDELIGRQGRAWLTR